MTGVTNVLNSGAGFCAKTRSKPGIFGGTHGKHRRKPKPSPIWSPFRLGHQALSLTAEHLEDLGKRVDAGGKKAALAREFGISRETLYQYLLA